MVQSSPVEEQADPPSTGNQVVPSDPPADPNNPDHEFKTFADFDALNSADEVTTRCASELTGVEILKGKSGKIYLMSNKKRIVAKHTLIGGYGAGKYFVSAIKRFGQLGCVMSMLFQLHCNFLFSWELGSVRKFFHYSL